MDILIRKIQRKGKDLVFKPNSKSGYKFTSESAQPCLTAFQKSCIKTKPQKDRKLGSFWTPNFCHIGSLMVQNGEVSLLDMLSDGGAVSMTDFNNYFPSKKYYWYNKAKPQNPAMETYFIGVRAAANILAHYYNLQKLGQIKEAGMLYKKYLKPLGLAKLLNEVDSNLLSDDDYIYPVTLSARNCVMKAQRASGLMATKNNPTNQDAETAVAINNEVITKRSNGNHDNNNKELGVEQQDSGFRPPKLKNMKRSEPIVDTTIEAEEEYMNEKTSKKNPNVLPKNIGDK